MGADEFEQMLLRGEPTTMDDIVRMTTDQKPKELSPLAKQLLDNWQGLGTNVGIGSAGTERAEIGGRPLAQVAEDFAQRLSQQGITDLSQAKFSPGAQAAWTAEGRGNVSLVATRDGRLVPVWGSSSDAGKVRQVALALGSALIAPGLAGTLGGGLAGSAGAGALLGAGRAAITGGDILKGALTGGLTGGAGYGVSTLVDPFAADIGKSIGETAGKTVGEAARGAISGAARSAVGASLTGGSIGDALLSGAISGGTNAAIGDTVSGLPKELRGPVGAAISAGLLGKDPTQAAIMSYAGSLLKSVPNPFGKGFAGGIDMSASDAIEGLFDPGGEGYAEMLEGSTIMEPDLSANLPSIGGSSGSMQETTGAFGDWYQEGAIPSYSGVPEWDDALDIILQEGKLPGESGQTIEVTGRRDDMSIDPWLHPFLVDEPRMFTVTEGEPQTIEVTGKLPVNTPEGVIIPDWDINPEPVIKTGESSPATKTGGTGSTGGTKAGGTGGTKSGGSKDTKDSGSGLDLGALFGIMGALANQQQPMRTASPNVARIDTESPFGLMYGLRG